MPPAFLQVAIPVLYVYDEGTLPEAPPGFDMGLLPVISRALKEHANTSRVTVITGAPTAADDLPRAYTSLGLQYATIKKASPEAGNLLVAEFVADHFDLDSVLEHLKRIQEERNRELAETVEMRTRRPGAPDDQPDAAPVGSAAHVGHVETVEGLDDEDFDGSDEEESVEESEARKRAEDEEKGSGA